MFKFFILLLFPIHLFSQNLTADVVNVTENQTFEVWISENNDIIFNGTIYPKRRISIPMTSGKLYGFKTWQIDDKNEPAKIIKDAKLTKNCQNCSKLNGIDYYLCTDKHFIFQLIDKVKKA